MKQMLPGGMGSAPAVVLVFLAVLALWLASGLYRVDSGHKGVVMLFGEYVDETDPGLHWYLPSPIGNVISANVEAVRRVDIGTRGGRAVPEESLMLTGDQNISDLNFVVQWTVKNPSDFVFNIRDPEGTVKVVAESAMREVIGQTSLQVALTGGRAQIEQKTHALLQSILDSYAAGITITRVQLLKVDPPQQVIAAFNDVQSAKQDKERAQNQAEAYSNRVIPTARGEAERMRQQATAYRERVTKEADGEAQRFLKIYESYKVSKAVTSKRLYLETMEAILSGADKVIIDSDGQGVVPYLPLNELKKGAK